MAGGVDKFQLYLQGRVAQQAGELGLGLDFGGHQVQHQNMQRPNVLGDGPGLAHDEDILAGQGPGRGEAVGDLDRHEKDFLSLG